MNPKISVLIPAYNHEKYLKETIDSVLNQTFTNFELLIYDDCSTDSSAQIIKSYTDERITAVFAKKNGETVAALNKLVDMATGEYIAVLGSDDVWLPEKLQQQLDILESNPKIAASFTRAEIVDENSNIITEDNVFPLDIFDYENKDKSKMLFDFFMSGNHLCHSSVLIRTSVHREIGLYNPLYRQLHDLDLWIRVLLKYNIHISDSKLLKYRIVQNYNNVSAAVESNNIRLFNEAKSIMLQLFNNISDDDFINGFNELFKNKDCRDPIAIVCEKFLILKENSLWDTNCKTLPLDFISDKLSDRVVARLEEDYDVTIKDIYNLTGDFCSNYHSDIYNNNKLTEQYASNLQLLLNQSNEANNVLSAKNTELAQENAQFANENNRLNSVNEGLKNQNNEILSSNTWKIASKMTAIMSKLLFWRKK